MKKQLTLLYGGKSAEHNVSLQTAKAVMNALDHTKFEIHPIYITTSGEWIRGEQITGKIEDVAELKLNNGESVHPLNLFNSISPQNVFFPLLHGPNGEDGTVQGLLELANVPYVGNGVLASSAGMDKVVMKNIFAHAGLPQVGYVSFLRSEWEKNEDAVYETMETKLGYPCFVKPANLGSSVGISKCVDRESLQVACKEAFLFDRKIIVEQGVVAREIEIALLGNDEPNCSVVGEIEPKAEFYDYKAKYEDNSTGLYIPADVTEEQYAAIKDYALKAWKALDCSGLVRADFFLTREGELFINEVNTMPGFTPVSMFPLLWKETGVAYSELIETLVNLALERYEEKQKIKYTME